MTVSVGYLITELAYGGAQTALLRLLTGLDRERFSPAVACLYNGDGEVATAIRALGVPVFDARMRRKADLGAMVRLYRWIRRIRPQILHTHLFHTNLPGRILGRLAGVPIVVNTEHAMGMESRWRYRVNRLTLGLADREICISRLVAGFFVRDVGIPQAKVVIIPNGVEMADFDRLPDRESARRELGLAIGQVWIGTVARLDPVKRLDVLLRAIALLPDVSIVIVGDGPEREPMAALGDRLGLGDRVRFVGWRNDVSSWLAALDVFVLSSDWEGMSYALLEAMAAGLPVVATAVGGTPEVVVDGATGLLVPPDDPARLAEAIARLVRGPGMRQTMGEAGRKRVTQHFSASGTIDRTQELYVRLLEEKGLSVQVGGAR